MAVDAAWNLYLADQGNHRIRRITADGTITTVAGTGEPGFDGDGDAPDKAKLNSPTGVAIDRSGNLYLSTAAITGFASPNIATR